MDHVEPTFSLEAIDSQSGCGSSHTSVISAIVAIIVSSSSPTALRSFFGNGDTSDFPTMFSEGSGDLGLVCLTGVVTQGSGTAMDDEEEDAPPGFGTGVSSSIGERFAASSSESGSGTSCISGLSDVLLASGAAGLGGGSRYALGIAGSGAFQMGSFLSPTTAFGGLPRVVDAVFQASTPCLPQPLLTSSCPRSVF